MLAGILSCLYTAMHEHRCRHNACSQEFEVGGCEYKQKGIMKALNDQYQKMYYAGLLHTLTEVFIELYYSSVVCYVHDCAQKMYLKVFVE